VLSRISFPAVVHEVDPMMEVTEDVYVRMRDNGKQTSTYTNRLKYSKGNYIRSSVIDALFNVSSMTPQSIPVVPSGPGSYHHVQSSPSTVWDIPHHLGINPAGVQVINQDGEYEEPSQITYPSSGQVMRLWFEVSISGTADVS
jgi:hypothetical protein